MDAAIKTAVGVLLIFAAVLLVIVFVRTGYERYNLYIDRPKSHDARKWAPKGRQGKVRQSKISFDGKALKRQEAAEFSADTRKRYLILGGGAGAVLSALGVQLWLMQVLSSDTYTKKAEANAKTTISVQAPRGRIFDRNGEVLVDNRAALTVMAQPDAASDANIIRRLSVVLGIPYDAVRQRMTSTSGGAQADRVVATDASNRAVAFISEHPEAFPYVYVESRAERTYPYGSLAAHVLGYTGTISEEELAAAEESGDSAITYESGDVVGKAGAEYQFESVLQGIKGERVVEVDAGGNIVSLLDEVAPQAGNDVRLTIDLKVQKAAEQALSEAMAEAVSLNYLNANAGAIVCLDVKDGGVIAMASAPTFEPERFIGGISTDLWESLTDDASGYPLSNRAIAGQYPAASTFKAFTGMAGLQQGYISAKSKATCNGTWTGFGEDWPQKCWDYDGHGTLAFVDAIVESCDVYFYEIARQFYRNRESVGEDALQDYLMQWGFGAATGIDLPGEASGRVPTPEWKAEYNRDVPESAQWVPGDYSNLIIGQGDLLVTPLQIAEGYLCIAGDGTAPVPHILYDVLGGDGKTAISYAGSSTIAPDFSEENLALVREGLEAVVSRGHVTELFTDFDAETAGKTGTGEVAGKDDYAWYVGYGPVSDPQYVCACIVEQGGSGGTIAAPAVRLVLATALGLSTDFSTTTVTDESR